ncbi:putative ribonuclease H-like domain-containing protein [Tanacetum coccineum]
MVTDSTKVVEGVDELASILDIHSKFVFGLYGYFVGKRVAFPVVENYVKNAWKKFGLVHVVMNSKGFFFFKIASIEDGLSVMATKLGNPIMLDSYMVSMCLQSWGRMNYARALIDTMVDRELKEDMVIVIPKMVDDLVNEDNDNEVEEIYYETATYMASTSFNESHGEDPYDDDDFDDPGLTDAQMKFANAFDINLRGQLK